MLERNHSVVYCAKRHLEFPLIWSDTPGFTLDCNFSLYGTYMVSVYFGQLETVIKHYSRNNEGYLCYLSVNYNNRVWGSWTQYKMYCNHILSNFESFKVLSKITIQLSSYYTLLVFFLYLQWLIKGYSWHYCLLIVFLFFWAFMTEIGIGVMYREGGTADRQ